MKKLTLSISVLVIILVGCAGPKALTESGEVIPTNTNRIYIYTKDSPDAAFSKFGKILQLNGYGIEYSDKSLGTIKASKTIGATNHIFGAVAHPTLYVTVVKKDNSTMIQLHGTCNNDTSPIRLYGQKGSPMRMCWNAMYSIAKKYKGAKLEFAKK